MDSALSLLERGPGDSGLSPFAIISCRKRKCLLTLTCVIGPAFRASSNLPSVNFVFKALGPPSIGPSVSVGVEGKPQ